MLTHSSLLVWAETGLVLCLYLISEGGLGGEFSLYASAPLASLSWEAKT